MQLYLAASSGAPFGIALPNIKLLQLYNVITERMVTYMKNVYEIFIDKVSSKRQRFSISIKTATIKVGNKILIKNGKIISEDAAMEIPENVLGKIEELYGNYYRSIPSMSDKRKLFFYAPTADEMDLEDMIFGEEREVARAKLEGYIVCLIASGFKWKEEMGSWFWKSPNYPKLILLREWFELPE